MPYGFIMRRKYFAGNVCTCIISNSKYLSKSKCIRNIHLKLRRLNVIN